MSTYSFLGVLALSLVPAYGTYWLVRLVTYAFGLILFPRIRRAAARKRAEDDWANRPIRLHQEQEAWQRMKPEIMEKHKKATEKERKEVEKELSNDRSWRNKGLSQAKIEEHRETYRINTQRTQQIHEKFASGYRESVQDVVGRLKRYQADELKITLEELEEREKQAERNGEPLAVFNARIDEAKAAGVSIEAYEAMLEQKARRRRRISQKASELGYTIHQMEQHRKAEAARKGISVDMLEAQLEADEVQHAVARDDLYTDPNTIANTAANTGTPVSASESRRGSPTKGLVDAAVNAAIQSDMSGTNAPAANEGEPTNSSGARRLMKKLGQALETPNMAPDQLGYQPEDPIASQDPTQGLATAGSAAIPPQAHQHPATGALANDEGFWEIIDRRATEHRRAHGCGTSFCTVTRTDIPLMHAPFQKNAHGLFPTADVRLTKKTEAEQVGKRQGSKAQVRQQGREAYGLVKVPGGKGLQRWTDKRARELGLNRDDVEAMIAESGGTLAQYGLSEKKPKDAKKSKKDDDDDDIDLTNVDFSQKRNSWIMWLIIFFATLDYLMWCCLAWKIIEHRWPWEPIWDYSSEIPANYVPKAGNTGSGTSLTSGNTNPMGGH